MFVLYESLIICSTESTYISMLKCNPLKNYFDLIFSSQKHLLSLVLLARSEGHMCQGRSRVKGYSTAVWYRAMLYTAN